MTDKNPIGLLIGRFQPFHNGHLFLINKALEKVDRLIVGIGSANRINEKNPLSYEQRRKILETVFTKEKIKPRIIAILPIDDYLENDSLWLKKALEKIKKVEEFDLVIGNDEWTDGIFEKAGHKVWRTGFYKRYLYEGEKIRRLMVKGREWKNRVPKYLVRKLSLRGYLLRIEAIQPILPNSAPKISRSPVKTK